MSVSLETHPGVGLDWHWREKKDLITAASYEHIFLQSYSTLDEKTPGDPTVLIDYTKRWTEVFKAMSPTVKIHLVATWSRPDLTFVNDKHWSGKPINQMALDIRQGYDQAAHASGDIADVVPVGEAFNLAIDSAIAVANPYQPHNPDLVDLWTYDHYHASTYGYYLEALMMYSTLTHRPATDLGQFECAAHELGLSPLQAMNLQRIATQTMQNNKIPLSKSQPLPLNVATSCTP